MESAWTTAAEPFAKNEANKLYPHLTFENDGDWRNLGIGYHRWLCGELNKFADENEDLTIHVWFISWDRALHEIKSHWSKCDVIQVPSTWTAHLVEEKILSKVLDEPNQADYPEKLLKTCYPEGSTEMYAIPWQIDVRVLFYRSELTDDPTKLDTFKEFRQCLDDRKTQMEHSPDTTWQAPLGIRLEPDWNIVHNVFRYFFGGRILEKAGDEWKVAFRKTEASDDLRELWDLSRQGLVYFDTFEDKSRTPSWRRMAKGLVGGRYDAIFGGLYMRSVFDKRPDVKILVARLPRLRTEQSYTFLGGCHLAITKMATSQGRRPLARKLIERLTREKTGIAMFQRTEAIPAHLGALREFFNSAPRLQNLNLDALLKSAEPYPSIALWATIVERDIGLGELHKVLQSIEQLRDWEDIVAELEVAAERLEKALAWQVPVTEDKGFFTSQRISILLSILTLIVLIIVIVWIVVQGKKLEKLIARADQRAKALSVELGRARDRILEEVGKVPDQVSDKFQWAQVQLMELRQEIAELTSTALPAEEQRQLFENLSVRLGTVQIHIDSIQASVPESTQMLQESIHELEVLISDMDKIRQELTAKKRPPLGECTLQADIGYQYGQVTLKLTLFHNGVRVGTPRRNWTQDGTRLFDLSVLRMVLEPHKITGVNLSDYILIRKDVPISEDRQQIRNTAQRFITRFRREIYDFAALRCIMTNPDGQEIPPGKFMLQAFSPTAPKHTRILDRQVTESDKPSADSPPPAYEFVLDRQVASFQCNLIETTRNLEEENQQPAEILNILRECPRCVRGWAVFANLNLHNLNPGDAAFVRKGRAMLEDEAAGYDQAAQLCRTEPGQNAIDLYREDLTDVPESFEAWASTLEDIVARL